MLYAFDTEGYETKHLYFISKIMVSNNFDYYFEVVNLIVRTRKEPLWTDSHSLQN